MAPTYFMKLWWQQFRRGFRLRYFGVGVWDWGGPLEQGFLGFQRVQKRAVITRKDVFGG